MCLKFVNFVTNWDQLGVPVTLNLNKKGAHQTFPGGCCSLIAIGILLLLLYAEINLVFFELNYSMSMN